MHKILGFVALAVNCYAWLSTFESSRTVARNKRPEIRQLIEKQKALDLVDKQQADATSLIQQPVGARPSASDDQILKDYSLLSGEMQGENQGREYRYLVEIKLWKTSAESLDPDQWRAQVLVMNTENIHFLSLYKAKPKVQSGIITLDLEEMDKDQALNYYSNNVSVGLKKIVISIDDKGHIQSGGEDEFGGRWKSRLSKIDMSSVQSFLGDWKGTFANGVSGKIQLGLKNEEVVGTIEYNHSVGVCRGKLVGFPHAGGQMILVGSVINDHTACISNYVIRFKTHENSIAGAYYDHSTNEGNEFRFQR